MQTYDGATVMSGHIGGVQTLLRQDYPFAYFFIVQLTVLTWSCVSLHVKFHLSRYFVPA